MKLLLIRSVFFAMLAVVLWLYGNDKYQAGYAAAENAWLKSGIYQQASANEVKLQQHAADVKKIQHQQQQIQQLKGQYKLLTKKALADDKENPGKYAADCRLTDYDFSLYKAAGRATGPELGSNTGRPAAGSAPGDT